MIFKPDMESCRCDNCQELFEDAHTGFTAVPEFQIQDYLYRNEWETVGENHYCVNCKKLPEIEARINSYE